MLRPLDEAGCRVWREPSANAEEAGRLGAGGAEPRAHLAGLFPSRGIQDHPARSVTYLCAAVGLVMDRGSTAAINIFAVGNMAAGPASASEPYTRVACANAS